MRYLAVKKFYFHFSALVVLISLPLLQTAQADHHLVAQPQVLREAVQVQSADAINKQRRNEVLKQQSYENAVSRAKAKRSVSTLPSERTYKALKGLSIKGKPKVKAVRRPVLNRPTGGKGVVQVPTTNTETTSGATPTVAPPVVVTDPSVVEADPRVIQNVKYQTVQVSRDKLPEQDRSKYVFQENNKASVPLAVEDTLIIKLDPSANEAQISALLEKYDFEFIEAFETLGAIKVSADLSEFFKPKLTDNDANATLLRGMAETINFYQQDPLVLAVSPDSLLSDKNITNLLSPTDIVVNTNGDLSESPDWGVEDIQADDLWGLDGATDGVLFGVLDVGFNRHEDLVFIDIPSDQGADNHGNHVAGIACGKHNGIGIRGVLPNCFVRPRSGAHVPVVNEGGNVMGFIVEFSQVLSSLNEFITEFDDVSAYNISLGYNWVSNFGINPDSEDSGLYRELVKSQGEMLISVFEILNDRGVLVFSAAGNDSTGLDTPIEAKFASPFNYAAITARERGINNGVIVEAHDQNGNRAAFSNTGGNLSCPGVDIISTIAQLDDAAANTSRTYASMSGTSMASPYCASAAVLLKLVTDATPSEIVNCMLSTATASDTGAPRLKLAAAFQACQS